MFAYGLEKGAVTRYKQGIGQDNVVKHSRVKLDSSGFAGLNNDSRKKRETLLKEATEVKFFDY